MPAPSHTISGHGADGTYRRTQPFFGGKCGDQASIKNRRCVLQIVQHEYMNTLQEWMIYSYKHLNVKIENFQLLHRGNFLTNERYGINTVKSTISRTNDASSKRRISTETRKNELTCNFPNTHPFTTRNNSKCHPSVRPSSRNNERHPSAASRKQNLWLRHEYDR